VLPYQVPFTKDVFDNLLWWTNATKAARPLGADMKIGVSGASGHLGSAIVSELLQRGGGHEIVAISRTPATVTGPAQARFSDYDRPESLAEAMRALIVWSSSRPTMGIPEAQGAACRRDRRGLEGGRQACRPRGRGRRRPSPALTIGMASGILSRRRQPGPSCE
jgi:hypothetical protein